MEERFRLGFDETIYPTFGMSSKHRTRLVAHSVKDDEEGLISDSESEYDDDENGAEINSRIEKDHNGLELTSASPIDR